METRTSILRTDLYPQIVGLIRQALQRDGTIFSNGPETDEDDSDASDTNNDSSDGSSIDDDCIEDGLDLFED